MTEKKTEPAGRPSLGDFLRDAWSAEPEPGDFRLESPELLSVRVDGRLRARASAVLAASGRVRVTPASRFSSLTGKDESAGLLAAVDGKGRVLLGEGSKKVLLLRLTRSEVLVAAPHAILALEDTVAFSPLPVGLPLRKPVEWTALRLAGPGVVALLVSGSLFPVRVTPGEPLFARPGALAGWSANLLAEGRPGGSLADARVAFSGDGFALLQAGQ